MLGNNHPLLHITITYYQHIWGNGHPLISYSISLKVQIWHPAYTPWALWPASLQDPRGQDSRRETHGGTTQMAMNIWKDLESDHEALDHWGPIFKQTHVYKRFLLVKQHPWTRWTIVSWVDFSHRCTMWLKEKDCKFPKVSDLMILMENHEARPRIIIDLGLRRGESRSQQQGTLPQKNAPHRANVMRDSSNGSNEIRPTGDILPKNVRQAWQGPKNPSLETEWCYPAKFRGKGSIPSLGEHDEGSQTRQKLSIWLYHTNKHDIEKIL